MRSLSLLRRLQRLIHSFLYRIVCIISPWAISLYMYISSEQGGLIIRTELIYKYTIYMYKRPIYTYTRTLS